MILCDIGNTSYHFLDGDAEYKRDVKSFIPSAYQDKVYYISVNSEVNKKLHGLKNWIDISSYVDKSQYYESMGIDRIFSCEAIESGVVVDGGSAITVDIVKNGNFMGGFIYPGVNAMRETYKKISPALDYSFNFDLELDIMPKNSQDAISYGFLKTLFTEVSSYDMPIILTGGDASLLQKVFKTAIVENELIFKGMKKIIKKAKLC